LKQVLSELLSEAPDRMEARVAGDFDRIAAPSQNPVLIMGTGHLGEWALGGLRGSGVEPVAFCDNNSQRWGATVQGLTVMSPEEAMSRYKDPAVVIAIYNPSKPRLQLRQLGCSRIVPYPVVFWKCWNTMPKEDRLELPQRILARHEEFAAAYDLLSDDRSRREFAAQIRWRCLLDDGCLPAPDPAAAMYYPRDLIRLKPDETLVDCGAFDGDSIREFLRVADNRFHHIYGLEADPGNAEALRRYHSTLEPKMARRITLIPVAVGKQDGTVRFAAEGIVGSKVVETGPGIEVNCRRLDGLLAGAAPTFIKMDIEGAELDALDGTKEIIARHQPIMAVCAYHKCDHLWIIPQLLRAANADYRIFLRRYAEDCWETVYYAVPSERLPVDSAMRTNRNE
jgi:FkbM family methyltransferase